MKKAERSVLLGFGFDCDDGHTRITRGKNFYLFGGSKNTHKVLQEKAVKFNEQLDKKQKTLDELKREEFYEIAHKVGLKPVEGK